VTCERGPWSDGRARVHGDCREISLRRALLFAGYVLGLYLIVRAIAEPFVIDVTDPATYRQDWGGPSLFGVLVVHCGPGLLAAILMGWHFARRRARQQS
jgi:hypothetical protein